MYSRFKSINNLLRYNQYNSIINNRHYSTINQSPLNNNKKSLPIDFNNTINLLNEHNKNYINNNNDDNNQLEIKLPESIIKIQQQILNCNENEINDWDRVLAARTLNRIESSKNLHPSKLNRDILEKIWKLINLDINPKDNNYLAILGDQLGIAIKTWYIYPQVYNNVKKVVNEINKLEKEGKLDPNDETLSEVLKNAYHVAYVLGMWKEMIIIRDKMSENSIKDSESFYKSPDQFGAHQAFKIITTQDSNSIFKSPIVDIEQDSKPIEPNEIYPYKIYEATGTLFKNQKLVNVNLDQNDFKRLEDQFNKLNSKNTIKKDKDGYISLPFKEESFLTIIGKAVKYSDGFKVYSGVYNKESKKIQLLSNIEFPEINIKIEEQMDLNVEFPNGEEDISLINLCGSYRSSTENQGKSYIIDMDILYSFKINK